MQIPLIKGGVVVNIVEIHEDTLQVTKLEYNEIAAREKEEHEVKMMQWRKSVEAQRDNISAAEASLALARKDAEAVRRAAHKRNGDDSGHLDRVLISEGEVDAWREKVEGMRAQPIPPKPEFRRTKAWIVPDGHIVGPLGGNIDDIWDGEKYVSPKGKSRDRDETP